MKAGGKLIFAIVLFATVFHGNEGTVDMFQSVKEHFQEKLQLNAMATFKSDILNELKDIKLKLDAAGKSCMLPNIIPKPPLIPGLPKPGDINTSSMSGGGIIDKIIHPCSKDDDNE